MKYGIVAAVVFVAAYVVTISLYASLGLGHPHQIVAGQPSSDGTTVTLDIEELHSVKGVLHANLTVTPGPELLDSQTHNLKDDLGVAVVSPATPPIKGAWSKGTVPAAFQILLPITGDTAVWPFDQYQSGPLTIELFRGAAQTPERVSPIFFDRIPGWLVHVHGGGNADAPAAHRVELERSPSTTAFAVAIVGVLIAIAGVALFVAVQTARGRRRFQPPMTTWYAAMLFAVVPLRTTLPDAPPIGFWIDITVTLWVIVIVAGSMVLYISCWWRHLKPENPIHTDKPA